MILSLRPSAATLYPRNMALMNSILLSNIGLAPTIAENCGYLFSRESSMAVSFSKGMSILRNGISVVVSPCPSREMVRINTRRNIAGVHHDKARGNGSFPEDISVPMGQNLDLSWEKKYPVPGSILPSSPEPTGIRFVNPLNEGFLGGGLGKQVKFSMPSMAAVTSHAESPSVAGRSAGADRFLL